MGTPELTDRFRSSYESFKSYPNNLVYQTSYSGALQTYVTRLGNAEGILFIEDGEKIFVPFRDLGLAGQCTFPTWFFRISANFPKAHQKQNIMSDTALEEWLGYHSNIDPPTSRHVDSIATKEDPKCRFMCVNSLLYVA
jgi:hypothetical protein